MQPLELRARGTWDPAAEYWGDSKRARWEKAIIAKGKRPRFEMEQILPGENDLGLEHDPIGIAVDLAGAGQYAKAAKSLNKLCEADLRCLDAHAHLGLLALDSSPEEAIRHYEVGVRIGELSLGEGFDGVLSWSMIDNRPFLRCLHGYAICLWRLERFKEAVAVFDRMLWLNPADNLGVRMIIEDVRKRRPWRDGY